MSLTDQEHLIQQEFNKKFYDIHEEYEMKVKALKDEYKDTLTFEVMYGEFGDDSCATIENVWLKMQDPE